MQLRWLMWGLLVSSGLVGCQAPTLASNAVTTTLPLEFELRPSGYQTLALVSPYTLARIDHVLLTLYRAGQLVPGVQLSVPQASLGSPLSVKGLRMGTSYEAHAAAYLDAAGTQLISDASLSKASFTTPAASSAGGVTSVDETPIAVSIPLHLLNQTYTARATVTVTPMKTGIRTVRLTLLKNGTAVYQTPANPVTLGSAYTFTITTLKKDITNYTLQVDGLNNGGSSVSTSSTASFATTATAGAYQDAFGPFAVSLN